MNWLLWQPWPAQPGECPAPQDIHLMPAGDLRPHEFSTRCWCRPEQELGSDNPHTYMHRALDRREVHEGDNGMGLH